MKLNDWKCPICEKVEVDRTTAPTCCGVKMDKLFTSVPVRWKTPGFTRPIPMPKEGEK